MGGINHSGFFARKMRQRKEMGLEEERRLCYGKRKQVACLNSNLLHSGMKFKRETKFNVTKRAK